MKKNEKRKDGPSGPRGPSGNTSSMVVGTPGTAAANDRMKVERRGEVWRKEKKKN